MLDSPPEPAFDRITRLVCRTLDVPVALVSLVEAERQFFKSEVGLPAPWAERRETPLSHSFCRHVVATGVPLVVPDAAAHELVRDNAAIPELGVKAYLGIPLVTRDGDVLGSLCAIDTKRRDWSDADLAAMDDLAAMAVSEISFRLLLHDFGDQARGDHEAREAALTRLAHSRRLELLGQLTTGVAHDFGNVLQAVQAGVRMTARQLDKDPAEARHMLEMVSDVTRRGIAVTRRLLLFAHKRDGDLEPVEIGGLLAGLQQMLSHMLGSAVAIELDVAPDLPPVLTQRGELEAVLVNLANNARDAMPTGGTLTFGAGLDVVDAAAHPAGVRPGRYVRLRAADTGSGMDADTLARAAEPFFTTKEPGTGTGLGLAMAREYTTASQGGFAIASAQGRGTEVSLWIPCAA